MRLVEYRLSPDSRSSRPLPGLARVLYATRGEVAIISPAGQAHLASDAGWHGREECSLGAGPAGARVLCFELYRGQPAPGCTGGTLILDHPIDLDPAAAWLMRCDRVDFAPGGEAPLHRHRGGGIRCLLRGALQVTVGDGPPRLIAPGGAWFESGREPVHAVAAPGEETSFIRVTIQPAEIRGRSSILYVNPGDATRTPRAYTVFVDEPISL